MSTEDRSEGRQSNANPQAGSETMLDTRGSHIDDGVQLKNQFPSVGDYAPKVRKPYTITKQREKWTEEEHKKFLEALKLYGRAWRRIEDHVGTKTAVQIRSHAQKFFSKVLRESNTSDMSPVEPIEIPPPRPKRKPLHPYPRKMVASSETGTLVGEQTTRSRSPNMSTSEQDNQSPTSVFSAISSEMYGTTDSNARNDSPSPVSSANGVNTSCFSLSEPPSSSQKGSGPSYLDRVADPSDPHEQVPMMLELFPRRCVSTKEAQDEVAPRQSLKLFGKTVSLSESRGPSSSPLSRALDGAMQYTLHVPVPVKAHSLFIARNRVVQKSGSWNSKSSGLVKKDWDLDIQNSQFSANNEGSSLQRELVCVPSDNSLSSGQRPKPHNPSKGFIPYKRCLAEREALLSAMVNEEREEKRIHLCL